MRITIIFDPLSITSPYIGPGALLEYCGLLPEWVTAPEHLDKPLREALEAQYGFGPLLKIKGATITEDLQLSYPGDPLLPPLLVIERRPGETFIQYPYALVCLRTPTGDFITRMD